AWTPTIELTIHFWNHPAPGPVTVWFHSAVVEGGYHDESGDIWDSEGRLVARSRQFARILVAPGSRGPGQSEGADHLAAEKLDARQVVGGVGEEGDHVGQPQIPIGPQLLDDLLRRARPAPSRGHVPGGDIVVAHQRTDPCFDLVQTLLRLGFGRCTDHPYVH